MRELFQELIGIVKDWAKWKRYKIRGGWSGWAIVQLMGHVTESGYVEMVNGMVKISRPATKPIERRTHYDVRLPDGTKVPPLFNRA